MDMTGFRNNISFDSLLGPSQPTLGSGMMNIPNNISLAQANQSPGILSSFLPVKNADGSITGGWGSFGWDVLKGATNAYLGMQQLDLAKKNLAFNEDSFWANFNTQKQLTNTRLEDRQRARVASNPGAYQSVSEYMTKNGVK